MRVAKDINTDLMTLPELRAERDKLLPKIDDNYATVREVRRFTMIHSLISMFENAKIACRQIRKHGNLGQQIKQELIQSRKAVTKSQQIGTPVLRNGFNGFPPSEDINDI